MSESDIFREAGVRWLLCDDTTEVNQNSLDLLGEPCKRVEVAGLEVVPAADLDEPFEAGHSFAIATISRTRSLMSSGINPSPLVSDSPVRSSVGFAGHAQQEIVELLAEEERCFEQLVEFRLNAPDYAGALGLQHETKSADHIESHGLREAPGGAVVDENRAGTDFNCKPDRSHSPSPSRPRDVIAGCGLVGACTAVHGGRIGMEGAISRTTAGGIRTE